jgi:excisionase family DNA binding protein
MKISTLHQSSPLAAPRSSRGFAPPRVLTDVPMLTPFHAWRLLRRRTGGEISRTTFYRWIRNGNVYAVRLGHRFYVPYPSLEEFVTRCLHGERY